MRKVIAAASLSIVAILSAFPAQAAVNTSVAGPGAAIAGYATPVFVVVKAAPANFVNLDPLQPHDLVSVQKKNGVPIFKTTAINAGQTVPIQGLATLPADDYDFYCSIHAATMKGTLTIVA